MATSVTVDKMASLESSYRYEGDKPIKLIRWKIQSGSRLSHNAVILVYTDIENGKKETDEKPRKLKSAVEGTVQHLIAKEGDIIKPGATLLQLQSCTHPVVMKDLCAQCGADLRKLDSDNLAKVVAATSVSMVHSVPELRVSHEQAQQLGQADEQRLLKCRKLVLLVDLDQTLIHTTNDNIPANIKDVCHFQLYGPKSPWYHTRLRPGTMQFLQNVSKCYELHICTFGARPYAHKIAQHLDHDGKFFSHRILSRDECFNPTSKTGNLKALFPCGDSMVCIIDDREDVWNFATNLVPVKPYHFFRNTGDINAPPGLSKTGDSYIFANPEFELGPLNSENKCSTKTVEFEKSDSVEDEASKPNAGKDDKVKTCNINYSNEENDCHDKGNVTPCVVRKSSESTKEEEMSDELDSKENILLEKSEATSEVALPSDSSTGLKVVTEQKLLSDVTENENKKTEKSESREKETASLEDADKKECTLLCDIKLDESQGIYEQNKSNNLKQDEKVEDTKDFLPTVVDAEMRNDENSSTKNKSDIFDVSDDDDYLLYLEEILLTIHKAYYHMYDQMKNQKMNSIPDLKNVIPYVRKKVLKGVNIVFSGVIPTNMAPEKSRLWIAAKSLGANITSDLVQQNGSEQTTHIIAAKLGTAKLNKAKRSKGIHIVTPDWLWCCAERWEHADERLFPLTKDTVIKSHYRHSNMPSDSQEKKYKKTNNQFAPSTSKMNDVPENSGKRERKHNSRLKQKKGDSKQNNQLNQSSDSSSDFSDVENNVTEKGKFSNSYSPLLSFSTQEITDMGREVDDACSEESVDRNITDSEISLSDIEGKSSNKRKKKESDSDSSSIESLTGGECPRGWKKKKGLNAGPHKGKGTEEEFGGVYESEDDAINMKFPRRELPHDSGRSEESKSNSDEYDESIGSVDEEMAAAVEREFLKGL